MSTSLLTLDTTGCDVEAIGSTHGLVREQLFADHAEAIAKAVAELKTKSTQDGGWAKWLNLGNDTALADEIQAFVDGTRGQYDDVVLLGIGGSALGAKALLEALCHPLWNLEASVRNGNPRLHIVENVDSDYLHALLTTLHLRRTLVLAVSKSGTTIEPMSALLLVMEAWEKIGITEAEWSQYLVMVTDPAVGLFRPFAERYNLTSFVVPDDVGGRFSVFSAVGLLPAALVGIDIHGLQAGIRAMAYAALQTDIQVNPAAQAAVIQMAYLRAGKPISVFMPYSRALNAVADWYVQLWAESLGKAKNLAGETVHVGPTPVKAVGATDQHSQLQLFEEGPFDKVVTFIEVAQPTHRLTLPTVPDAFSSLGYLAGHTLHDVLLAELAGTRQSLASAQRPTMTVMLPKLSAETVGALLFFTMVQTALAGALLAIDPFDQPGVEGSKRNTKAILSQKAAVPA